MSSSSSSSSNNNPKQTSDAPAPTRTQTKAAVPPSPSASFYDMSDDEEGEYNTIRHSQSGKGVKLLYSKSKAGPPWSPSSQPSRLSL